MAITAASMLKDQSNYEWVDDHDVSRVTRIKSAIPEPGTLQPESKINHKLSFGGIVEGHDWVPDGNYWVSCLKHEIEFHRRYGYKLVVYFSIREGNYTGQIIRAFYNLEKSRKGLIMREGCRWVDEMRELFPELAKNALDPLIRPDPYPVSLIQNKIILAKVVTSSKGKKKKKHHTRPYSVVRRLIRLKD